MASITVTITEEQLDQLEDGADVVVDGYDIWGEFLDRDDIRALRHGHPLHIECHRSNSLSCEGDPVTVTYVRDA